MGLWKDFREFAIRGNVIDLAVAVVIGGAFGKIVTALVEDLLMPLVGLVLPGGDWREWTVGAMNLRVGHLLSAIVDFLCIAFVLFLIVKRLMSRWIERPAPAAEAPKLKSCPECLENIPALARRCRACASVVAALLLCLVAGPAAAQVTVHETPEAPKKDLPSEWSAQLKAGFLLSSGNARSLSLSSSAQVARKWLGNKLAFEGGLAFARSEVRLGVDLDGSGTLGRGRARPGRPDHHPALDAPGPLRPLLRPDRLGVPHREGAQRSALGQAVLGLGAGRLLEAALQERAARGARRGGLRLHLRDAHRRAGRGRDPLRAGAPRLRAQVLAERGREPEGRGAVQPEHREGAEPARRRRGRPVRRHPRQRLGQPDVRAREQPLVRRRGDARATTMRRLRCRRSRSRTPRGTGRSPIRSTCSPRRSCSIRSSERRTAGRGGFHLDVEGQHDTSRAAQQTPPDRRR